MCWAAHRLHHALHDMLFHGTSARLLNITLLSSTSPPRAAHALPRHQCEITQYHAAQQYCPTTRRTCSSTAPERDYSIPRCSAVPHHHALHMLFHGTRARLLNTTLLSSTAAALRVPRFCVDELCIYNQVNINTK